MPQLNFTVPAALLQRIEAAKPDYLDRKGFLCLLLDEALTRGLTGVVKLPAYRVGAGTSWTARDSQTESLGSLPLPQPDNKAEVTADSCFKAVGDPLELKKLKNIGSVRKVQDADLPAPKRFIFAVPSDLDWCKPELLEYWRKYKSGKKTEVAARILINGCRKIAERYGQAALREQIELACGYGWENITLANYERYGVPARKQAISAAPEQPKHPASREFRNGRFVDEDLPVTNPLLKEVF